MTKTHARLQAEPVVSSKEHRYRQDRAITDEDDSSLGRSERRLLRRIFNGRTVPIIADGRPFLTFKEASRYLVTLAPDAREAAYAEMKRGAANESSIQA